MLITPRTYFLSQTPDRGFLSLSGWHPGPTKNMLLVHQTGSVHVGEVVRYTLTYAPAADPILPTPSELHVRVRNTSAIPLRAAYLRGPYTLHTSCYPANFDPNSKYDQNALEGIPQFEPNLKAGGSWDANIPVPSQMRPTSQSASASAHENGQAVTWIIDVVSQVVFSTAAVVHFELFVTRDKRSLNHGYMSGASRSELHRVHDHRTSNKHGEKSFSMLATKGVFSKSITLRVDDTSSLWSTPSFPSLDGREECSGKKAHQTEGLKDHLNPSQNHPQSSNDPLLNEKRKKRVHFVVLTHGLHSNLGADMLFLKESIDSAARKAQEERRRLRETHHTQTSTNPGLSPSFADRQAPTPPAPGKNDDEDENEEVDEEVIVRGFPGNVVRTERGIQYLGKRLAKYILLMTYPDQPYLPARHSKTPSFPRSLTRLKGPLDSNREASGEFPFRKKRLDDKDYGYKITSISFIGHSLGGLVQMYAIAYIQKHSPNFFDLIKPINFIALATPFLGLSNENPIYVRFALDFGLVGRTGQDLGLSWTGPRVRSGWGTTIVGAGNESDNARKQSSAESKLLLRILPTGPANQALLKFRNRTLYSNVVNDGIVPLRTSCLLFLDWRGLNRVEKARRENGLVGTVAEWGWAELTGANSNSPGLSKPATERPSGGSENEVDQMGDSPLPKEVNLKQTSEVYTAFSSDTAVSPTNNQYLHRPLQAEPSEVNATDPEFRPADTAGLGIFGNILSIFRPKVSKRPFSKKQIKIYKLSQTVSSSDGSREVPSPRASRVRGDSLYEDESLNAPPKTTVFESAGDLLKPPLPPIEYILDPAQRPNTIFHDRIYHPEDIPQPLVKRHTTIFASPQSLTFNFGSKTARESSDRLDRDSSSTEPPTKGMKVEEKIARAYHHDLLWRKVLVRLEPDAHNNIIVRRMFANAYGWPVIKHLVDTHFGIAQSNESLERHTEDPNSAGMPSNSSAIEVVDQRLVSFQTSTIELSERPVDVTGDYLPHSSGGGDLIHQGPPGVGTDCGHGMTSLRCPGSPSGRSETSNLSKHDFSKWSDVYSSDDDGDSESEDDHENREQFGLQ
ncbi:putative serine esterase (DUF676) domain containing protein [Elaphomyces granulatus]